MNDVGLRARKMARTRDQIADAALVLFGERGYDATTLEEVAERADVHKRTLLRYFPTKAHLVLHYQYEALDEFNEMMRERGEKSTLDVWSDHVVLHSRQVMQRGKLSNTRRIARSEPALGPAYLAIQQEYVLIIAAGLEKDLVDHPEREIVSKVAAAALVGGNYAVGHMVLRKEAYGDLERAESEVVRLVREKLLEGR
jgi:AcrR family transcriptional regulator